MVVGFSAIGLLIANQTIYAAFDQLLISNPLHGLHFNGYRCKVTFKSGYNGGDCVNVNVFGALT